MTVLIVLVILAIVVGVKQVLKPLPPLTDSVSLKEACTQREEVSNVTVRTRDVTVSVFNASDKKGLANTTLDTLTDRGFKAGQAGNAPTGVAVDDVIVRANDASDPRALLVAQQFGPDTTVQEGDVLGPGVTVIVGAKFGGIDVDAKKKLTAQVTEELCD